MSSEAWLLTVVRLHGIRLLRPEKSWRPIVTVVVDHQQEETTTLGCDGQNVNLKEQFRFPHVNAQSQIEICVWRKSDSKKKGKKRQLAALVSVTLGELLKKQGTSPHAELKLKCMNTAVKPKSQPQKCATITLKLRAPLTMPVEWSPPNASSHSISDDEHSLSCFSMQSRESEETPISDNVYPDVPISDEPQTQLRKRRVRGYKIDSDDSSDDEYDDDDLFGDEGQPNGSSYDNEDCSLRTWSNYENENNDEDVEIVRMGPLSWIAYQILPSYTQHVDAPASFSWTERFVDSFSPYKEMMDATSDSEFQGILNDLKIEWRQGMTISMALCGLNATIFGFTPDILFSVNSSAKKAVAFSGISSGIGLVVNFWYQFIYAGTSGAKFRNRACDMFGTYFFFCLSCRLPTLLMALSSCALLAFIAIVAFRAWPQAVIVVAFFAGILVSLQYLVFGAHRFVLCIRWVVQIIRMNCSRIWNAAVGGLRSAESSSGDRAEHGSAVVVKKDGVVVEVRAVEDSWGP